MGACRLCLVEMEGQRKLQAACLTKVEEGMVVRTDTPQLRAHRKLIVELLLAERNHVCAVCVDNGACELQDLAGAWASITSGCATSFRRSRWISATSVSASTTTAASCARAACASATKWRARTPGTSPAAAPNSRVITDLGEPWGKSDTCTGCGKCVQVCPTGALFDKGRTVAEMRKDRGFLKYIVTAREKKQWIG